MVYNNQKPLTPPPLPLLLFIYSSSIALLLLIRHVNVTEILPTRNANLPKDVRGAHPLVVKVQFRETPALNRIPQHHRVTTPDGESVLATARLRLQVPHIVAVVGLIADALVALHGVLVDDRDVAELHRVVLDNVLHLQLIHAARLDKPRLVLRHITIRPHVHQCPAHAVLQPHSHQVILVVVRSGLVAKSRRMVNSVEITIVVVTLGAHVPVRVAQVNMSILLMVTTPAHRLIATHNRIAMRGAQWTEVFHPVIHFKDIITVPAFEAGQSLAKIRRDLHARNSVRLKVVAKVRLWTDHHVGVHVGLHATAVHLGKGLVTPQVHYQLGDVTAAL